MITRRVNFDSHFILNSDKYLSLHHSPFIIFNGMFDNNNFIVSHPATSAILWNFRSAINFTKFDRLLDRAGVQEVILSYFA